MQSIKNQVKKLYRMYNRAILLYRFRKKVHNLNAITDSYGLNKEPREKEIIVSLTSYPARLNNLHYTVKSILCQSLRPDKLILYLGDDCIYENLPDSLRELERYGLQIFMKPGNLKPHKKYYYAIKENPEDIIITVDDDIYYEKDLIASLLDSYKRYPHAVSARRVHKMTKDEKGNLSGYNNWDGECESVIKPSMGLFAIGVGGVLYPPHCMPEELFNKAVFKDICMRNDDIWLKFMQILNNVPVVYVRGNYHQVMPVVTDNTSALSNTNIGGSQNDLLIKLVEKHFGISLADYI